MLYNVSFIKNDVYQSNLYLAESEKMIMEYCDLTGKQLLGIHEATKDDIRPDKPTVNVESALKNKRSQIQKGATA